MIKEVIEGNLKKDQTYNLKVEMSICLHRNTLMLTFSEFTYNATLCKSVLTSTGYLSTNINVQSLCKSSFADLRQALKHVIRHYKFITRPTPVFVIILCYANFLFHRYLYYKQLLWFTNVRCIKRYRYIQL